MSTDVLDRGACGDCGSTAPMCGEGSRNRGERICCYCAGQQVDNAYRPMDLCECGVFEGSRIVKDDDGWWHVESGPFEAFPVGGGYWDLTRGGDLILGWVSKEDIREAIRSDLTLADVEADASRGWEGGAR